MSEQKRPFSQMEEEVLKHWESNHIFEKTLEKDSPEGEFVFYDGPPFATGLPHYGHLLASTIKDVIPRYKTMRGYHVRRVWGWDCHGLPIENIVETQLEISGKKQIEEKGVDVFNETCRSCVLTYAEEWGKTVKRIGRWVEFENSYKTMDAKYMESVWWAVKQVWEKGLLYEGRKVLLYCPRCETPISNFEVAMDNSYKDVTEESVYVKFRVKDPASHGLPENTFLVAWTTTPWTLPGNVALAVGEKIDYVVVEIEDKKVYDQTGKVQRFTIVVAKNLFEKWREFLDETLFSGWTKEGGAPHSFPHVKKTVKGSDLVGIEYEPLYEIPAVRAMGKKSHYVTSADFVTTEEGTGIVHTAVVYGEDDYNLGLECDLPIVPLLDSQGKFTPDAPEFLRGSYFKDADRLVKKDLDREGSGLILMRKQTTHSYPHCWRCSTPLFYNAIPAWFINVQKIKDRLIELNEDINWYPEHLKEGRFKKGLESAPDWNISRNRYWATAIPIWKCESEGCEEIACIGSVAELRERSTNFDEVYKGETDLAKIDLHKPYIDGVFLSCEACHGTMRRIPEVVDCWVESASMPYAELHAPFENQDIFEKRYPAQFVAEYIAQTRAWFYVMHVMGTILFDKAPFENVVTTGTIMNDKGEKLSKSKKNYTDPSLILESYGADALRFYLMTSVVMKGENLSFVDREVEEVVKKVLNLVSNCASFYKQYEGQIDRLEDVPQEHVLDRWVLALLSETVVGVTREMDTYDTVRAGRLIRDFIGDLSQWYVRRSRDRFKGNDEEDKRAAMTTLRYVLIELSKLMAPFTPFIAEKLYRDLGGERESVHLEDWPAVQTVDEAALAQMARVRELVTRTLEAREQAKIPVRQALSSAAVQSPEPIDEAHLEIFKDEVNVQRATWKKGELSVQLDTNITPELRQLGIVRELVRRVNDLRKQAGLTVEDRIVIHAVFDLEHGALRQTLKQYERDILEGTRADRMEFAEAEGMVHVVIGDESVQLSIEKE